MLTERSNASIVSYESDESEDDDDSYRRPECKDYEKRIESPGGHLVERIVLPGIMGLLAVNHSMFQNMLGEEKSTLKQLDNFYYKIEAALKGEDEIGPIVTEAKERHEPLVKADACGRPFKVNDFLHLENQADSRTYQVQLKRELWVVRGESLVMTGVWTIRLPHPAMYAGENAGAEAQSPDEGSDLSDRYSNNTAGTGDVLSEIGSIGGPSLKRPSTDLDLQTDQKRLRRKSTPSPNDIDSIRSETNASKFDPVAPTASTHGS